jgi:hypothetical protein
MIQDISVHISPRLPFCDIDNDTHIRSHIRLNCQGLETRIRTVESPSPAQPSFNHATEDYTKGKN